MTNQEVVTQFLNGFNNPSEIGKSLDLLVDDYRFKDPIMEHHSKASFIVAAQEMAQILTGLDILHIAENGAWVGVVYNFKSNLPGLENNLASEWFRVEDGNIHESQLIFDASQWRSILE